MAKRHIDNKDLEGKVYDLEVEVDALEGGEDFVALTERVDDAEGDITDLHNEVEQTATVTLAAGAANVMGITIQLKNAASENLAERRRVEFYMSTDNEGDGLTSTSYSGDFAATSGVILTALTAKKHITGLTDATGKLVLTLTATAKPATERVCVVLPNNKIVVSAVSGSNWGA